MSEIIQSFGNLGLGTAAILALVIVIWKQLETINKINETIEAMQSSIHENTSATKVSTELISRLIEKNFK